MISVVIRNKNEAVALDKLLALLHRFYKDDINEIIVVDNHSTDNSLQVIRNYGATVISIDHFTYGKALNLGIKNASQPFVALLSAHAYPLGERFFKDSIAKFQENNKVAGLRYINSFKDYERFLKNDGFVEKPLKYGMMNACAMIRKSAWEELPYDERIVFSEDKLWSQEITRKGYHIEQIRHSFFYHMKRDSKSTINRWSNETIANYILQEKEPTSSMKYVLIFFKSVLWDGMVKYVRHFMQSWRKFKSSLSFRHKVNEYRDHNE